MFNSTKRLVKLVGCAWAAALAVHAQGKWVDLAPFPEPKEEVMGEAANGKLYVFAGLIPLWHPAGLVYEYDPAQNAWTKKKPMALPSHHVAFCEHDGKIYAFGGFVYPDSGPAAWVPINNTWEYDPGKDSWKALAPMPTKRGAAEAVEVNDKIYVIGGRVGAAFIGLASDISLVEVYDPAADQWGPPGARMPTARSAVASAVYNGRIYIAGGEWQDPVVQTAFRVFEAYDPATNTWSTLSPMATPRHGVAGAVIGNRFYAVSGDVQSSGTGVAVSTPAATAFEFTK